MTTLEEALAEVERLRNGIRSHRDEKGHDRCWEDDLKLYALLPDQVIPDGELPSREEFLRGCARFYELRRKLPKDDAESEARRLAKEGTLGHED